MEEIDFTPNARVRYLGETRGMCPEQHSALEFVAETIVQVAREAANGGIPYLEGPFAARSFVNRYRLQAGMDRITGHITDNSSVNSMPKKYLANGVSAGEQGQGSRNEASSHQRTSRGSRTHSSDDQSASDHPRGEGMRIRGIANEFSFGHERDVNSFSTKPGCSSPTLSSYEEEPRWEESYIAHHSSPPMRQLQVPETYMSDERPVNRKGKKDRLSHGSKRVAVIPHCCRCLEEFPDKDTMHRHVRNGVCRQAEYNRNRRY